MTLKPVRVLFPRSFVRNPSGFTFIEILMALSIATIMLGAIASLLFASFEVLRILDGRKTAVLESTLLGVRQLVQEIQQSPVIAPIPFKGDEHEISFPMRMPTSVDSALNAEFKLGQVQQVELGGQPIAFKKMTYRFDPLKKQLFRKSQTGQDQVVLDHIRELRFSYWIINLKSETSEWKKETPASGDSAETKLLAMKVNVLFDNRELSYTIPGVERIFMVSRRHPLDMP